MTLRSSNKVFRALADPIRRDILRLLLTGRRTSGEIAARFGSSWPTISRHLMVLREAGLVMMERHCQEIYYELNTSIFEDLVQHVMEWVEPQKAKDMTGARQRCARRQQEGLT